MEKNLRLGNWGNGFFIGSIIYIKMNSASQPMPPSGQLDICKKDLILKCIQQ